MHFWVNKNRKSLLCTTASLATSQENYFCRVGGCLMMTLSIFRRSPVFAEKDVLKENLIKPVISFRALKRKFFEIAIENWIAIYWIMRIYRIFQPLLVLLQSSPCFAHNVKYFSFVVALLWNLPVATSKKTKVIVLMLEKNLTTL